MGQNATGARHGMEFVAESAYGVTPATPAMTPIRHVSTTLGLSKETYQSQELRADRQISDFRHGNRVVGGDIAGELSYGSFDDFLEAVLGGTWAVDTPIAGTDQLKAGVALGSFTIRRRFTDIGEVQVSTGVKMASMSLNVNAQLSTISFGTMGKDMVTTDIAGATLDPETSTEPMSGLDIGTINLGGAPIAILTEIGLTLDNGLNSSYALGDPTTTEPVDGRSNLTGTMTAFFQNSALLDRFIDETETAVDFEIVDPAGNKIKVALPRVKYSGGQPDVSGEGEILLTMPFQALYDATPGVETNITIERTPV